MQNSAILEYRTAKFKTEKYRCIYDNNIINTAANNYILTDVHYALIITTSSERD